MPRRPQNSQGRSAVVWSFMADQVSSPADTTTTFTFRCTTDEYMSEQTSGKSLSLRAS
jgi:hypothetical protein